MKRLLLKNGRLILPDKILEQGSLLIREGRIAEVLAAGEKSGEMPDEEMNLEGDYLAPGFIDIHVHGGGGGDFMDADEESWRLAMGTHIKHGTTAMCPTTMAASKEELEAVFSLGRELAKSQECYLPRFLGLHMEGPYIAESMKGAQDASCIKVPEEERVQEVFQMSSGILRILTAAPELPGSDILARAAKEAGILLSAGHSDARFEDVEKAVRNGYTMVTHLYSSMSTIIRENGMRRPGLLEEP